MDKFYTLAAVMVVIGVIMVAGSASGMMTAQTVFSGGLASSGTLMKEFIWSTEQPRQVEVTDKVVEVRSSMDWDGNYWCVRRAFLTFTVSPDVNISGATLHFHYTVGNVASVIATTIQVYNVDYGDLDVGDWDTATQGSLGIVQYPGVNWEGNMSVNIPASAFNEGKLQVMIRCAEAKPAGDGLSNRALGSDLILSNIVLSVSGSLYRTLELAVEPDNAGYIDGQSGRYVDGTSLILTAVPSDGYKFVGWTGDVPAGVGDTPTINLIMDSNKSIVAHFEKISTDPILAGGLALAILGLCTAGYRKRRG